jgi:4-alpha-glucanotransferase
MTVSSGRHAGLLVPLFSMPSRRSWGIGEIPDLPVMARWLASAGLDMLQLLPVNEMAHGQNSPYSATSALAIDPVFISLADVEDFSRLGGERDALPDFRRRLAAARASSAIDYATVRSLKYEALRAAFGRFEQADWLSRAPRATAFQSFLDEERWWLSDYALFSALHERHAGRPWPTWEPALRDRDPSAVAAARRSLEREILFYEYIQWLADGQWKAARAGMAHVGLFGDFQFMVSLDSADVWVRPDQFLLNASVGVPPDAFSDTGQDWGLPVYRWDVIARDDHSWLRQRARRSAALYDGYRVDHVVGFYRTYVRPHGNTEPYFTPDDTAAQLALGERVMGMLASSGSQVIAEDLGTVPDFVRASLTRLGVPGYRVMRWEREWDVPDKPFRDPATYPALSVATSGTHDTDPLAVWWQAADVEERRQVLRLPGLTGLRLDSSSAAYPPDLRDALLETLYAAGSDFLLLPIQDVFGWEDRINVPATVADQNWTYRLPWPVDGLQDQPEASERAHTLRKWSAKHDRAQQATI